MHVDSGVLKSQNKNMKKKLDLSRVSLVCVETRHFDLAYFALEKCLALAHFKEALLLSASPAPEKMGVKNLIIPPIGSTQEYSEFILRHLGEYFDGEFVLLIQWDSFILNSEIWSDDFLECDYIGAPWPHLPMSVGNGGFSLRSRRLVNALAKMNLTRLHPEDQCISEVYRGELETEHGIVFATPEMASKFAFELAIPEYATFGFHGFFNFHKALKEEDLLQYVSMCSNNILRSLPARRLIKNLYRYGMFAAANRIAIERAKCSNWMGKIDSIKLLFKSLISQFFQFK